MAYFKYKWYIVTLKYLIVIIKHFIIITIQKNLPNFVD